MSEEIEIITQTYHVPASREVLADCADLGDAVQRLLSTPTPMEREAWERERAQRAAERAEVRRAAQVVAPTPGRLIDRLGWGGRYVEHFVQPYCRCEQGSEGWERCEHAIDLGIEVWM